MIRSPGSPSKPLIMTRHHSTDVAWAAQRLVPMESAAAPSHCECLSQRELHGKRKQRSAFPGLTMRVGFLCFLMNCRMAL